jgi:hypothetical protein
MLENKEKKKMSWVVTDGAERFEVRIFSDKVLENYPLWRPGGSERHAEIQGWRRLAAVKFYRTSA